MELLWIAAAAFLVYFFFVAPKLGNLGFWKLVASHPVEGWIFFSTNPNWVIGSPPPGKGFTGPYKVLDPTTQNYVSVYCLSRAAEDQSQKEFVSKFK